MAIISLVLKEMCVYFQHPRSRIWLDFMFDRLGCRDVDMDGYSNPIDDWIAHPDGFADAFPEERSHWYDTDSDGFGDNMEYFDGQTWRESFRGDGCRTTVGSSTFDDGVALIPIWMGGLIQPQLG